MHPEIGKPASLPAVSLDGIFFARAHLVCSGLDCRICLRARETSPAPRRPAKACIVLFMWGGPAQQDTWDLKPDAPDEYRGEFKPIPTTVPGLQICEHLPRLAQRAHELCLIRSMTHNDVNHTTATHHLLTGQPAAAGAAHATTGRTTARCWRSSAAGEGRCRRSCR